MTTTTAIPGSSGTSDGSGLVAWANPDRVYSSNNLYAAADDLTATQGPSAVLMLTGFDFATAGIDAAAIILGIQCAIERFANGNSTHQFVKDSVVKLIIGGSLTGTSKAATGTKWPITDTVANYGGTADLWGTTPSATQVRASNFGVGISVVFGDNQSIASIDYITLQITYTPGTDSTVPAALVMGRRTNVLIDPASPIFQRVRYKVRSIFLPPAKQLILPSCKLIGV